MVLPSGSKLLVCHRRLFHEDQPRFFAGVVTASEAGLAKVTGYSWSRDPGHGFLRKDGERTKIVALTAGSTIVYELPMEISIEQLRVEQPCGHAVVLTDGEEFRIDLTERLPHGVA